MLNLAGKIRNVLTPPEKRALNKHILFGLLISLLDILFLGVVVWLFNFKPGRSELLFVPKDLIDHNFTAVVLLIIATFGLKNLTGFQITKAQSKFSYGVAARLSKTRLMQYLRSGYFNYVNTDSSIYLYHIAQQPVEFSQYVLTGLQQIIIQGAVIFLTIAAIVIYSPQLFVLLCLLLLPALGIVFFVMRKRSRNIRMANKINSEKSLQHLKESLSAYVETQLFDKHSFFTDRYARYQHSLNNGLADLQSMQLLPSNLFEVFAVAGIGLMVLYSQATGHTIGLISIGVFTAAVYKIVPGLVKIITHIGHIKAYSHTLSEVQDASVNEPSLKTRTEEIKSIRFNGVNFNYDERRVLEDISFEINSGDFIGISGASGKGKTTMINLLLGFLEAEEGIISVNGKPAGITERELYRQRISYVKQSPVLINDTILKNIILSDEDDYDTSHMKMALAISGLNVVLSNFPDGLHTQVTEGGNNLSGGQCQRIMLARALYKDFDLLILDEPFNELDELSEMHVLSRLKELTAAGKIILLITHNGRSLTVCDQLISLNATVVPV